MEKKRGKEKEKEYGKETPGKERKRTLQARIDRYLKNAEGREEQASKEQQQKASSIKLGASGILGQRRQQTPSRKSVSKIGKEGKSPPIGRGEKEGRGKKTSLELWLSLGTQGRGAQHLGIQI